MDVTMRGVEDRVAELLSRMDTEDKLRQMRMYSSRQLADGDRFSPPKARELFAGRGIGAVEYRDLPSSACAAFFNELQEFLGSETRLGIPALVTGETLHGIMIPGATVFPQAIALASTWDTSLVAEVASAAAREASAMGIVQALAPDLDLARDPRWGRVEETYGEDPYLCTRLGVSYIRALQGTGPGVDGSHVVSTPKHFAAHGSPEGGVNLAPVACGERQLRELYLLPFRAAIREAGALSIMPAYSELDGIPCSASRHLLTDILRGEWGFQGYTFSDYGAVAMLHNFHRTASGPAQAGRQALEAGMDLEAPVAECYGEELARLVATGAVNMGLIDAAVTRILRVKLLAGLFDGRTADPAAAARIVSSAGHRALARRVACESIVLLKNDGGVLPFPRGIGSLAVIGPNADLAQLGDYAADKAGAVSPLEGIRRAAGRETTVSYARGCGLHDHDRSGIAEAVRIARGADAVVLCLGEASMTNFGVGWGDAAGRAALCGEGFDRDDIGLPGVQEELAHAVLATGVPVVALLVNGRPLTVGSVAGGARALLEAWYPGEEGGNAIADILFGAANPSGRLPISFPKTVGQVPVFYNHKPSARGYYKRPGSPEKPGRDYVFNDTRPLYPFGHGLSYTTFEYSDLRVSPGAITPAGCAAVSVRVRNTGARAGKEVVALYLRDLVSSVSTPVKALKGFAKVDLAPGEEREVTFGIGTAELCLVDSEMREVVEPGEFELAVGGLTALLTVR
jgi:beta-glucosidase